MPITHVSWRRSSLAKKTMRIATKRGRLPAAKKKRLKFLANEIKEQKQRDKGMEEARRTSAYYFVAEQILQACGWYYHDGVDIETVMQCINQALLHPVNLSRMAYFIDHIDRNEFSYPKRPPRRDYEKEIVFQRHTLRANDILTANMIYMIDNTVGMWYDGYYSDKLAMNLLEDFATVLMSGWSGRKRPLPYRAGK